MATLRTVPPSEWRQFFDRLSKGLLPGKWAEIEVSSPDIGDQIVAEWIPMIGVTYDSKDDLLMWRSTAPITSFIIRRRSPSRKAHRVVS